MLNLEELIPTRTEVENAGPGKMMMQLWDARAAVCAEHDELLDLCEKDDDREPTAEEKSRLQLLRQAVRKIDDIKEIASAKVEKERNMTPVTNANRAQIEQNENGGVRTRNGNADYAFQNIHTGEAVQAFGFGEEMAPVIMAASGSRENHPQGDFDIGRVIAARMLGRPDMMNQLEIGMSGGNFGASDPYGGFLLDPAGSMAVLDLARGASRVLQAGARSIPMTTREMEIVRLTGDVTAAWRAEKVAVTSSENTFDRVTLRAKTLAAIVPISIEMLEDSSNCADVIRNALKMALGAELDRAALVGTAAGEEPIGINNTDGIDEQATVGTPTNYDEVSAAVQAIMTANYLGEPSDLAWLAHPRDLATYDGLKDTTNQPLRPTPWAGELRKLSTTKLPTTDGGGSNESTMTIGDFSQLLIGMRTSGVEIRILPAGTVTDSAGDSYNAVSQLMRHIVAHIRADVVCLRPGFFSKLTGVLA